MRYRALSPTLDYTFGQGSANYLVDSPAAVGQAVYTALLLFQGEFFLDTTAGMPWFQDVIGFRQQALYDSAIQNTILNVQGVSSIEGYSSFLNTKTRMLTVNVVIKTIYSPETVSVSASVPVIGSGYGNSPYGTAPYGS